MSGGFHWFRGPMTLQAKLLASYALIIALLLFLGGFVYYFSISVTEKQVEEIRTLEMNALSDRLDEYLNAVEMYSRIIYTEAVQRQLNEGPPQDPIAFTRWKSELFLRFDQWYGYMRTPATIQNITIVTADGKAISKESIYEEAAFIDESWYREALSLHGDVHVAGPFERKFRIARQQDGVFVFSVVRKINNTLGRKDLGGIVIDIPVKDLEELLSSSDLEHMMILAKDHRVVYSSDRSLIGQIWPYGKDIPISGTGWINIGGSPMFVNAFHFPASGWRFVTVDSLAKMREPSVPYRNVTIAIGLLAVLAALALSFYFARKIVHPVRELVRQMKEVQLGNFHTSIPVRSNDEIGHLTHSFNRMTEEIRRLVNDVYRAELRRKEAELKALHSQINPHFLYNTLDSMNAIAAIENVPQLSKMASGLAGMFRYSISSGSEVVMLAEELEQVKRYIEIQQIRYGGRFRLDLDVPEELLAYRIPKLIIQPIVENALYHGLEMKEGDGVISIRGMIEKDRVRLIVQDNGVGMSADELHRLQQRLSQKNADTEHIGLANVQERLALHYGPQYGIAVRSAPGQGTTVTYTLPPP